MIKNSQEAILSEVELRPDPGLVKTGLSLGVEEAPRPLALFPISLVLCSRNVPDKMVTKPHSCVAIFNPLFEAQSYKSHRGEVKNMFCHVRWSLTWEGRKGFDLEHDHTSYNGESCEHDVVNRRNDRCVECIQCLGQHERET